MANMNGAQGIAAALSTCPLASSSDAIAMDDLVLVTFCSPQRFTASDPRHSHVPRILGSSFTHSGGMLYNLRCLFKEHQAAFDPTDSTRYISSSIEFMNALRDIEAFAQLGDAKLAVLQWCLCAHVILTHPASRAERWIAHKHDPQRGFGLRARAPILADQVVWEAIGMMPGDGEVISELASVAVAPAQNQPEGALRTLYGPLRLVNHRCRNYNAEMVALEGTSAFVLYARQDIQPGEWITVNYHSHRLSHDPKHPKEDLSCTCVDCIDNTDDSSNKATSVDTPEGAGSQIAHLQHHHPSLIAALEAREILITENEGALDYVERERKRRSLKSMRHTKKKRAAKRLEREAAEELAKKLQ
ncbi:hypothetical protein D9619_006527 [Psilocybe cf. subviscida]|uniref:SET domain-containing protein n=1 Tax=Psilocybe cf. subviscida TaxID=2480587 RepID=A0A8H5EYD0_9AGAR|nr:hypothetical protein D9619_006527 [Psilocybe cf. subviscida]